MIKDVLLAYVKNCVSFGNINQKKTKTILNKHDKKL